ncbi:MAG: hypothetical protein ACKVPX_12860 [Myxococcaceae bacterium]
MRILRSFLLPEVFLLRIHLYLYAARPLEESGEARHLLQYGPRPLEESGEARQLL